MSDQISFFENNSNKNVDKVDDIKQTQKSKELKELGELRKKIAYYNKKYYEEDISEISDFEYDKLSLRLRALESKYPEFKNDSPTSKIGGKNKDIFNKVNHSVQMQSLQDVFSFSDVQEFVEKVENEYGKNVEFVVETKIDGLSVSLEYENGKLVRGSTRGDGNVGEDVTKNLKLVNGIPHTLKTDDTIEVRGEVYLPRQQFEKINKELEAESKKILSNPRNAAAGTLRQLDEKLVEKRNLSIFVFNVQKGKQFEKHSENLEYLKNAGIKVLEYSKVCIGIEQVLESIEEIGNLRQDLAYDIDGAVVKINDIKLREEMGKTVKVPKWAVAYKYPPEQKETKILDILTQVGRTGQVTPLAVLEPIRLAGSIISKATLHNFDYIENLDIRVGDICVIEKAGDVIPEVVKIIKDKRNGNELKYKVPEICPVCKEKLEKQEDIVALKCVNSECPALIYRSIVHFASRDAMNIIGLGEAIVDLLIDSNLISDVADIYYLKYADILKLEGFKEKSAKNLIEAIEKSKNNPLGDLIFGLGISHIGKKAAKILSKNYESIYEIAKADVENLSSLEDFGLTMAQDVYNFFRKDKTLEIIKKLEEKNVNLKGEITYLKSEKLLSKKICITGSFENVSREEIVQKIEENGGKSVSSISKNTNYLIVGENAGSKLSKANELGIEILTYEQFVDLIN